VARSGLGTINHTVLTIEHLRAKDISVLGLIFVRHDNGELSLAESTGPELASQLAMVPNWGLVDFIPGLADCKTAEDCVALLPADSSAIEAAATEIIRLG
jgi:dethiobiotin synthetase